MFGFFKKEKKKSPVPDFDSRLIKKFHKDHEKLVKVVTDIVNAVESNEIVKAKRELKKLKMELLGHFMEEDIKLYWYLKTHYKESENTIETIKMFEESIKKIQKDVVKFLDHYAQPEVALDQTFKKEFDAIVEALSTRMATEESNLYPLYTK
jgi:iron-sulfur cluster repair protein YtfE (RIC family)